MTKCVAAMTALLAIAVPLAGAMAQALSPTPMFEGNTTTPAKDGATQAVHVVVQSWGIAGQEREIPLRGFYVAHLLSGRCRRRSTDGRRGICPAITGPSRLVRPCRSK